MEKSVIEEKMIKKIKSDDLKQNLYQIIDSNNKIWSADAPKLIDNYTDHGPLHSQRVLEWAMKLLQAQRGDKLSDHELYLLIASAYLHDIGMQCHFGKKPDVKKKAKKLGAKFDTSLSFLSDKLTEDEQNSIRQNHGFISAAWIQCARESRSRHTVIESAVKNIPSSLVFDLMDICKYHSSLSIFDCEEKFRFGSGRKRYIAALLRMADELDIDADRISLDTVELFTIPKKNEVFWWLHNRTKFVSVGNHLIKMLFLLNKDDLALFGKYIEKNYIEKFVSKNYPLMVVLAENNNPIIISTIDAVTENENEEPFPPKIQSFLQTEFMKSEFAGNWERQKNPILK